MRRSATAVVTLLVVGTVAGGQPPKGDPRAEIFVRRGCTDCHVISGLGARAAADVGPDLTYAYADVVTRYGTNLESFLADPTGVMRLMLASHLHLSVRDRDSMVNVLKRLYCERRAELDEAIPSLPLGKVARCPP
ncbi:MAG TPA: hypothetical protein VF978_07615 [Gemmatimonadales bacterium]